MAGIQDILAMEKALGRTVANELRRNFKASLDEVVNVKGPTKKATIRTKFREGRLDRLTFVAPNYIFKQHYGFEGNKKNGVNMRLQATNVLNKAIEKGNSLEKLADGLAELRADNVILNMNFNGQQ